MKKKPALNELSSQPVGAQRTSPSVRTELPECPAGGGIRSWKKNGRVRRSCYNYLLVSHLSRIGRWLLLELVAEELLVLIILDDALLRLVVDDQLFDLFLEK